MQFTYEEIGALLMAIGQVMREDNLCAGAARDGFSDTVLQMLLVDKYQIDEERAEALIKLTNEEILEYHSLVE
jgi:hypothetical protein